MWMSIQMSGAMRDGWRRGLVGSSGSRRALKLIVLLSTGSRSRARGIRWRPTLRPVCRAKAARLVSIGMGRTCQALGCIKRLVPEVCSAARRNCGARREILLFKEMICRGKEVGLFGAVGGVGGGVVGWG